MAAPSENRAIEAMKKVQALSGKALDQAIDAELGQPVLGVFHALAKAMFPGADESELAMRVHLMVLAYLVRVEVERPAKIPPKSSKPR